LLILEALVQFSCTHCLVHGYYLHFKKFHMAKYLKLTSKRKRKLSLDILSFGQNSEKGIPNRKVYIVFKPTEDDIRVFLLLTWYLLTVALLYKMQLD